MARKSTNLASEGTGTTQVVSPKRKNILPKYLRLNQGAMWFDDISGVKLYAFDTILVGRGREEDGNESAVDEKNNKDLFDYGWKKQDLTWFVDTETVPPEKQTRLILAYNNKILIEADPKNKPEVKMDKHPTNTQFKIKDDGDRVFIGANKPMYNLLQSKNEEEIKTFVRDAQLSSKSKQDLIDLLDYERLGHNAFARPRLEIIDYIRNKLKDFGPTMSAIRVNETFETRK